MGSLAAPAHNPSLPDRYGRSSYTPSQIEAFFDRIALPQRHRSHAVLKNPSAARGAEGLEFLAILQKYTLAAVPFESLALHYSSHHTISIDPQALFHKIVERGNGRGGYCMENSCLFGTVLRTLGYDAYPTGARVNEAVQPVSASKNWPGPRFDGWNHMINIVTIDGQKYSADVGFGSSGPHHPIPLKESYSSRNVGTQSLRLIRVSPPDLLNSASTSTSVDQALWTYQYRHTDESEYLTAYCFGETEFTPSDFTMMNSFVSTSRSSWFTYAVVCVKMVMSEDEQEELIGDVTLVGGEVKSRIGGTTTTLTVAKSEAERVEALQKYLRVRLSVEEISGIHGMVSELA